MCVYYITFVICHSILIFVQNPFPFHEGVRFPPLFFAFLYMTFNSDSLFPNIHGSFLYSSPFKR